MAKQHDHGFEMMAIVAIVAVVGLIIMFMNTGSSSSENLTGEAYSIKNSVDFIGGNGICGEKNQPACPSSNSRDGSVILRIGEVDEIDKTISVVIGSDSDISGFQFTIDSSNSDIDWITFGSNTGGFSWEELLEYQLMGGLAEQYGFYTGISGNNNIVLGVNLDGGVIPASNGILTTIGYSGTGTSTICITDALFITGYEDTSYMNVIYGECTEINFRRSIGKR